MRIAPSRSAALVVVGLMLAACGSSAKEDAAATTTDAALVTTAAPAATDAATASTAAVEPTATEATPADATSAPAAVTTAPPAAGAETTLAAATSVPSTPGGAPLQKPTVKIPATLPTELVITDLKEGTGPGAVAGDQVVVHYVGVRSADGTEFDNSYDRGQPFPVTLGQGGVIEGWDKGLVGVKQGGRRQLDIPSDLAYGDSDQGDVIKAGDALTFVVDVVAIIPKSDPANAPASTVVALAAPASEISTNDLVEGTGNPIAAPSQAVVQIVGYQADTGAQITSTWSEGGAVTLSLTPEAGTLPSLVTGVTGMKIGGRRQITIPYAEAFGDEGNPGLGLPPKTDLILIVDLVAIL